MRKDPKADNPPTRRGVLAGAVGVAALGAAGLGAALWYGKDMGARLFNRFTLDNFVLEPVAGLVRADGAAVPGFSSEDFKRRLSVLNFWASWCPPCREEHHLLTELAARRLAPIYGANVKDRPEQARAFLAAHQNPYTAVGADSSAYLQRALGARGVPATFVIGPGPIIVTSVIGQLDPETIATQIVPALIGRA